MLKILPLQKQFMSIDWNFPESNYSQRHGISEAGVETYRGSLSASLAREVCQNSLDARLDFSKPVTVEFSKFQIKSKNIPGYSKLKEALNRCLHTETDSKSRQFFEKACEKMENKYMDILRISDFNTTGLTGSKEAYEINPWQSLIKASGISDKKGTLGGSYGIGKSVSFAYSDIRTVFYTTFDVDKILASQGVSRLISFPSEDPEKKQGLGLGYKISIGGPPKWKVGKSEKFTQGIGYYGETEKNTPIFNELKIDPSFKRKGVTGTDLYIIGCAENKDWKEELIISVLDSFLVAIYEKKLIVRIEDTVISSDTLKNILETLKINEKKRYFSIWSYYRVLVASDNPENSTNSFLLGDIFRDLGEFELNILYDNLNRKVLVSRANGMKVFDLDIFSSNLRFSGIFILKGEKLDTYFKEMESPQHDSWQAERHSDKNAKNVLKELKQMIKNKIIKLGAENVKEQMDAEGIGKFLPDDFLILNDPLKKENTGKVNYEDRKITVEKVNENPKKRNLSSIWEEELEKSSVKMDFSFLDYEDNMVEVKEINYVQNVDIRLIVLNKKMKKYKIIILPDKNIEKACIRIRLSGEQKNLISKIRNAYKDDIFDAPLIINQDKIYIDNLLKNQKYTLSFVLNYSDDCSMEVDLYEYRT